MLYEAAERYAEEEFPHHLGWRRYLEAEGVLYRFEHEDVPDFVKEDE